MCVSVCVCIIPTLLFMCVCVLSQLYYCYKKYLL